MRIPSVKGKFDSAVKYLIVCGLPSSSSVKFSLGRLGMSPPFFSFTLKKNWTTLTLTFRVSAVSCSSSLSFCWALFAASRSCWSGTICTSWAESVTPATRKVKSSAKTRNALKRNQWWLKSGYLLFLVVYPLQVRCTKSAYPGIPLQESAAGDHICLAVVDEPCKPV